MEKKEVLQKENKMGVMPVPKLLFSMSLPMVISMLIQACYNIVDSIFVARVSDNALTAVSLAYPIQMLMISVAVGTGVGMNSLISRRLGEKHFEAANDGAANGLFLLLISSVVFMLLGLTLSGPFFKMFTQDPEIQQLGASYLTICMGLSFGVFLQIGCERVLQATGNTVYPMFMQLTGAIINIILDPILIFGYFGFPAMGVAGAAIATVAGQILAMFFSLYLLFGKKHAVSIKLKGFKPNRRSIRDIYAVGVPSIAMQSIGTVMSLGMNKILVAFTPIAVNVFGVYFKLNSFIFMPVFGMTNGAMSIMGYNYGARNRKRLMETWRVAIITAFLIMLAGTITFHLIPDKLLLLFDASEEMLAIGMPALRIISLSFPSAALCIVCSTMFQAVAKGVYSLVMSLLRQIIVLLPVAFLMSRLSGLLAVWWAFPVSEVVAFAFCAIMFLRVYRRMILPLGEAL